MWKNKKSFVVNNQCESNKVAPKIYLKLCTQNIFGKEFKGHMTKIECMKIFRFGCAQYQS